MIKQSDLKLQWKRQERNENMKIKHLALVLAGVLLLTGCGSGQAAGTAEEDSSAKTNQTVDEANKGMGRYVEAETDLSDICRSAAGLRLTKDGTLYLCDAPGAVYESTDQGENWNPYELPSLEEVVDQSPIYFITMDMAEDGSLWAVGDHSVNEDEWNPQLMHFPKEGSAQIFDKLSLESGEQPCQVRVSDNGKVFLADYGANIYEVKEDQTVTKVLTADGRFSNLQIHNNLLAFYPDDGTGVKIYDLDQKEYVEDAVLDQFMQENYPGASSNGYSSFQVFYFWGNDDAFYVAGKSGLHRHVIGGGTMEEVINGGLSVLSNPNYWYSGMVALPDHEFLMLSSMGKLIRFTYDATIPSVPEKEITIYSLEEEDALLSAISTYQSKHPDVYVNYEVGMPQNSSVTKEDAIKNLNTEVLSGDGPDVLIMDGLPMDSFVEKGLLLDLTDFTQELSTKILLYENLVDGLKKDEKQYVIPLQVQFPVVAAKGAYANEMNDLKSMADAVEALSMAVPGDVLSTYSPKGIMRKFMPASAPSFKNADGTLNREAILTFWEQTKRIYDVQMASASEEKVEQYQMILPMYEQEYGSSYEDSSWFGYINALDYIGGSTHMMAGIADTPYTQAELYSLSKNKGCEDAVVRLMIGTAGKVYIPELMIGINASSANVDSSKEFLTDFLGDEILESMGGFPVSKTAMEQAFVPNPQDYVEGQPMYYAASSDPEGNMIEEQIWWPVDGDLEPFYRMVEEVTVPYVQDAVLEEAVYQAGTTYFEGASTLEEAWDELQSQISLYMAE